ncbi:MAG: TIGR01777 family protein [Cytophagales bacterium]|nr:MAG: TIGR01777 family protein [Cytophagales bacterium]
MPQTVLITGATGSIGRRLAQLLIEKGYAVSILSSSGKSLPGAKAYQWNIETGQIDPQAVATADAVIHLAGAGIADGRWSDTRKREILESRTQSTALLAKTLRETPNRVRVFVSSSAIGYYGGDTGDRPMTETSPAGSDFLAQVTRAWERSVEAIAALKKDGVPVRTVRIRTGVVLTMAGGALPKLVQPIKLGAGAPIGSGQQYISWIHVDDVCRMFIQAVETESWHGAYNGVAPDPVTNEGLTREIAHVLNRPLLLPKIPAFAIKLAFGELAVTVLGSSLVLNKRIAHETTFGYRFPKIREALEDLLK